MSLLQMILAGAAMILVIVVVRALAIYQLSKSAFLLLWGVAAARLLIPYSLPSALSVYSLLERTAPATETVAAAFATSAKADGDLPGKGPAPMPDTVGTDVEMRTFSFEHTTFRYGEREYDMTLRNPSINSILSAEPVGDKIVVEWPCGTTQRDLLHL